MFSDPEKVRLGRAPSPHDRRTLKLANYTASLLPPIPDMKNWGAVEGDWPLFRNDELGDCTVASAGHMILLETAAQGRPLRLSDQDVVDAYSKVSGYNAGNPDSDRGANQLDVLKAWRKDGIGGQKIKAFVSVPVRNAHLVKTAIYLFGSLYAGVALPLTAQRQGVWSPSGADTARSAPASWGRHAVALVGYDTNSLACITWGQPQWMTQAWWQTYGEEAYAVISERWAPPTGTAPNAFNLSQLEADLAELAKEQA